MVDLRRVVVGVTARCDPSQRSTPGGSDGAAAAVAVAAQTLQGSLAFEDLQAELKMKWNRYITISLSSRRRVSPSPRVVFPEPAAARGAQAPAALIV